MNKITVEINKPSGMCELYPNYDIESNILEVSSLMRRDWPYGIDIDGNIIFDIDANYRIANFDLLIPKNLWRIVDEFPHFETQNKYVDLSFNKNDISLKSFTSPIIVSTIKTKRKILIDFGIINENVRSYPLSQKCSALIGLDHSLCGFNIAL